MAVKARLYGMGANTGQGVTHYLAFFPANLIASSENQAQLKAFQAYTFSALGVQIAGISGTGTGAFRKNAANSTNLTYSGTTTGWVEDLTGSDTLAVSDLFNWRQTAGGSHGNLLNTARVLITYEHASVSEAMIGTGGPGGNNSPYNTLGTNGIYWTTESDVESDFNQATTISSLRLVIHSVASVGATDTYRPRKNGADSTNVSISMADNASGAFEDTTGSEAYAAGDRKAFAGTPSTGTNISYSVCIQLQCDNANDSKASFFNTTGWAANTSYFGTFGSNGLFDSTTDPYFAGMDARIGSVSAANLHINVLVAGAGTRSLSVRISSTTSTNLTVTITVTGVVEDLTGTDSFADTDGCSFVAVSGSTVTQIGVVALDFPYVVTGPATITGQATISGAATVTPNAVEIMVAQATIAGAATMTPLGRLNLFGQDAIAGAATLTATGQAFRVAQATIAGQAGGTLNGVAVYAAQATIAGVGAVNPTGFVTRFGQATIAGAATLSLTGSVPIAKTGAITISGNSAIGSGITKYPQQTTGAGALQQWTTVGAASPHAAVADNAGDDDDTSYRLYPADSGVLRDFFTIANPLPTGAAVNELRLRMRVRVESLLQETSLTMGTRLGGVNANAPAVIIGGANETTNYVEILSPPLARPGGGDWTRADLDTLEIWYGTDTTINVRVTSFSLQVFANMPIAAAQGTLQAGQVTIAGVGAVSATGSYIFAAQVTIAGAAAGTLNASQIWAAQVTITGVGTVAPTGFRTTFGQATIAGTSAITAGGNYIYAAQVTIPGAATLTLTGLSGTTSQVVIAGTGIVTATPTAVFAAQETIAGAGALTATGLTTKFAQATIAGIGAVTPTGFVQRLAQVTIPGVGTVQASATFTLAASVAIAGAATLTGDAKLVYAAQALLQGQATLTLLGGTPKNGTVTIAGAAIVTATATIQIPAQVLIAGLAAGSTFGTIRYSGAVTMAGVATLDLSGFSIAFDLLPQLGTLGRVQIEAYSPTGVKLNFGRIQTVLAFSYTLRMDALGDFKATIPADDDRVSYLTRGTQLWFYREGEGLIFKGIVARKEFDIKDSQMTCEISGSDVGEELQKITTLGGRAYQGATLATFVADIVSGTAWSAGALDVPSTQLLARFDYATRVAALLAGAEQFKLHARLNPVERTVDVGALGDSSGFVFQNVDSVSPLIRQNPKFALIADMSIQDEGEELWNKIIPVGGGEGVNQTTLRYSTRSSPYTIQSATGPDGLPYYYISDATSVATYGTFERAVLVKDAMPLANSIAGQQAVANALYDIAVNYLTKHKDERTEYKVHVAGLKHYVSGVAQIKPGQKARVRYHGFVQDKDGSKRVWRTVDSDLWILEFTRTITDDGGDEWDIPVSTVDRKYEDFADKMVDAFNSLHTLSVSLRNYTFQAPYILQRISIDPAKTATLYAKLDANISLLHLAKLTVTVRAVRSNVSVASSGGGSTSSGGTSHSHSVSGSTSSGGASHSHTINAHATLGSATGTTYQVWQNVLSAASGGSTGTGSAHNHSSATTDGADGLVGVHAHTVSGGSGSESSHTHGAGGHTHAAGASVVVTSSIHGHDIAANATVAESSHTHTISGSTSGAEATHTHTVSAHTHPLTYGIFIGTNPTSPAITIAINGVDRTVALGGPFNTVNSEFTLDVTQYLQNGATEVPVQATNTITFDTAVLCDIEAVLRLDLTRSALIPV